MITVEIGPAFRTPERLNDLTILRHLTLSVLESLRTVLIAPRALCLTSTNPLASVSLSPATVSLRTSCPSLWIGARIPALSVLRSSLALMFPGMSILRGRTRPGLRQNRTTKEVSLLLGALQ